MSERRIGVSAVARCQARLMQLVTYVGSVSGRARDPLEWFPLGSPAPPPPPYPTPPRMASGFVRG
jgi:hypothetical protein